MCAMYICGIDLATLREVALRRQSAHFLKYELIIAIKITFQIFDLYVHTFLTCLNFREFLANLHGNSRFHSSYFCMVNLLVISVKLAEEPRDVLL